jgi:large subunit ribosomal protein L32
MGVQKSKVSRSHRDKRRTHHKAIAPTLSVDKSTGETHIRHHMTKDGYYRGRQIIETPVVEMNDSCEEDHCHDHDHDEKSH